MSSSFFSASSRKFLLSSLFVLALLAPRILQAQTQPVTVTVSPDSSGSKLPPRFLGLSYESSMLLPNNGNYYFDSNDEALLAVFQTLGIKNLRVGANAVDDPHVAVPQKPDIDMLFRFASTAGVKVIYSFRLKNGDPTNSAQLASYIQSTYADNLDSFSIGNEPSFYLKTFPDFFAAWKPHYDAILKAVPNAMFDGPSVAEANIYAVQLADAIASDGHLAMASDHYYFLGSGRAAEKDPAASRARFLNDDLHTSYEKDYAKVGAVLAAKGIPYRIDEMNSCYNGGAKNASDTYASTLWALDCTHWWAAHHILGVNFHTGESVGRDGGFGAANYAAFVHAPDGNGFVIRPQAYAYLAFTQGAHGWSLPVKTDGAPGFNFDAYAYRDDDGSYYVTLINKSYGDNAKAAKVKFQLGQNAIHGTWKRMDLVQEQNDVAAKTGITLGGTDVSENGVWNGAWKKVKHAGSSNLTIGVAPASATLLHFFPKK
ncbi:MAG TPA: hypothetical protein VK811_01540 [Candidatus Acidoferrum sp.]|jgi:hypothetical protein|nr:hypothetical protein [Candidatus Acidoferrum sp.]